MNGDAPANLDGAGAFFALAPVRFQFCLMAVHGDDRVSRRAMALLYYRSEEGNEKGFVYFLIWVVYF